MSFRLPGGDGPGPHGLAVAGHRASFKSARKARHACLVLAAVVLSGLFSAEAATIGKANNTNTLNKGNSWTGNKVPSSADIAQWGSGVTGANTSAIGGSLSWLGIEITSPGGLVTINGTAGRTLTLGTGGINMSAATQNLNLNAAVMLGAGQTWDVAANRMITATGVIGGAGRLTKAGAGTLTLTGANTFSGGLVVNGGAVQFNSAANLGTSTGWVALNGGNLQLLSNNTVTTSRTHYLAGTVGALQVDSGSTLNLTSTVANATSAGGSLVKTGAGTLILSSPTGTTYGGAGHTTAINGGTLQVANDNLLGNAANTVSFNGGTLLISSAFASSRNVILNGPGTINTNGYAASFSGPFSGSGSLSKNGAGTLSLTAANTYSGGTTINAGTLQVNNTTGSGTGTGAVTVNSGGTLSGLPGAGAFASPGSIAGVVTVNSGGAVTAQSGGTFTFGGLTLNAASITNFQLATPTSTAIINITGVNGLSLAGSSTVNLTNIGGLAAGSYRLFDYTGTALPNLNNLSLGSTPGGGFTYSLSNNQTNTSIDLIVSPSNQQWGNDANGNWGTANNWTNSAAPNSVGAQANFFGLINQARTVTVDGAYTAGSITFDSLHSYTIAGNGVSGHGVTLNNSNGGTAVISVLRGDHTISAPLTLANHLQISASTGTALTLSGVISGAAGGWTLNSDGSGAVTFSGAGANTFTGLTTVAGGNLNLAKTAGINAIGAGGAEVRSGATLSLLASNQIADTASVLVNGTFALGTSSETIGALAGVGSVTSGGGSTLTVGAANNLDSHFEGTISGGVALIKEGAGTLSLNGINSYTGGTTVNSGTIEIHSASNLGHISGTMTIGNGTVQVLTDVSSSRNFVLTSVSSKIKADAGATYTLNGTLSGTGTLNKHGDGTLVLNGTNTYTGGSTINGGTVVVNSASSLGNSSTAVNLNAGTLQVSSGFNTTRNIVLGSSASTSASILPKPTPPVACSAAPARSTKPAPAR